jgi:hypothetical protein
MAAMKPVFIGDEPTFYIWWIGNNGSLVNLSSGYTFQAKLYRADDPTRTALFTKTTGFTGAAGTGTSASGTPNLTVAFATTNDFNTSGLTAGLHVLQVKATDGSSNELTNKVTFALETRV